jgi:hypothetical protein
MTVKFKKNLKIFSEKKIYIYIYFSTRTIIRTYTHTYIQKNVIHNKQF